MPPYCKTQPYEFERLLNGRVYEGIRFFDTREQTKAIALEVRRRFDVSARSITISESSTDGGWIGGYEERYLLMLPIDQILPEGVEEFIYCSEEHFRKFDAIVNDLARETELCQA